jgi:two-component sensor histidine kinase/PAS domain-containing protein
MNKRTKSHRPDAGPFNPPRSGKAGTTPPPAGGSARPRRSRMEEALRESEKRFHIAVEAMLDGFAILSACRDKAGRIVDFRYEYVNEAGCRINGRSREETLGRTVLEMFPALEGSETLEGYVRTVETEEPLVKEAIVYSGIFAGGEPSTRAFDLRAVKMGDGVAVSWMDVTGRKKAVGAVANLASFPELNPSPVVEVDADGSVCYVNPTARRLFPGLAEAGASHPWLAGLGRALDRFRQGEERQASSIVAVDGRHYHQMLLHVDGQRRIRIYGIDISERVAAEEASRRRAEELETLLESVPALVWFAHDRECLHITGNRAADEFLHLPRGAEASLTASRGNAPTHFKAVKDGRALPGGELPVQRAARGEPISGFEYSIEFADGTVRHLVGNATPLYDAREAPRGSVSAFVDITDRKGMEEALRTSLAEKDTLFRELSHRTKNNMQVIVGLLDLQAAKSGDGKLVDALTSAQDRIRAMALVHEKLYRSGSVSSIGMKGYVDDLVASLLKSHQEGGGPVTPVLDLEEVFLSLDAALPCGLIINELVSNSLKHAFRDRAAGSVFLTLRNLGEEAEFRYRDDGPGLPKDLELPRIGSLGLKLVRNLAVRQLRGTMELVHDPRTEFVFRFRDIDIMKRM